MRDFVVKSHGEKTMLETQGFAVRTTLSLLIKQSKNTNELKQIYSQIITSPFIAPNHQFFLITRLLFVSGLSNFGSLSFAIDVFRAIQRPNLSVYNIMIRAYASQTNYLDENYASNSLILYKQMLRDEIFPDCLTFPFLVKECTKRLASNTGQCIHGQVVKLGLFDDVFIRNSFISLYTACGFLISAHKVFDEMSNRDIVSWNSLIIGFLRNGDFDGALGLFRSMTNKNIITWNSIITGLVQGGRPKEALELFHEMQIKTSDEMIKPDKITIASVITACSYLGSVDHGKWVHDYLKRSGLKPDNVLSTTLVDMYGKCGSVERAFEVFEEIPEKDTLAWTAMISVFALNGHGEAAFRLFEEMELTGLKPNQVTFVALLSGCAHSGLVEKGRWCFETMRWSYSIEPQVHHYACMVDILSRAGLFEEAERLIRGMLMKPDVFVWGALLRGCQLHGNVELGVKVSLYLLELEPHNHAFYVNLCHIYGKAARFDELKRLRILMTERGIKKETPGCSMIEVDGVVFEFSVKGSPSVEMAEVIWTLEALQDVMKIKWNIHPT